MKIIALIVTYNRLELLKESLIAVKEQTLKLDKILVYNNNSSDGTTEYLNKLTDDQIIVINAIENTGGAGGFHYGLKEACRLNADWIWLMDDDTIPKPTALQFLVESPFFNRDDEDEYTGFLASRVDWIDGKRHLMNLVEPVHPWHHYHGIYEHCYRIINATFVSLIINRAAVEKVGLPVKEFFIWGDDWEYTRRISQRFSCFYISNSVVIHKTKDNFGSNVSGITRDNYWKYRYDARNASALYDRTFRGFAKNSINLIKKLILMKKGKVQYRYRWGYVFHTFLGLFFNYRKKIEFIKSDN
jgi:GT2 family glycosyltransferase